MMLRVDLSHGRRGMGQPHGRGRGVDPPAVAKKTGHTPNNSDLVYGKDVTIEVETIDKYGRTVGTVMVGGEDANLQQVKQLTPFFQRGGNAFLLV